MSLRLLYRLVLFGLAVGGLAALALWAWDRQHQPPSLNSQYRDLKEVAAATRGTVLRAGGPAAEYVLPPSASSVRLLTNAALRDIAVARRETTADPTRRWQYAIEIEETRADASKSRQVHEFRRSLSELVLPNATTGSGSFYLSKDAPWPMAAATLRLDYAGAVQPTRLRIRLISADPAIADVLLRVGTPEPISQRSAEAMWRRLSDEQRKRLASGNVFPAELLEEKERVNLLASRWHPLGPSGEVEGRDIYVLDVESKGPLAEPARSAMLVAGPGRLAVVQLPETGGTFQIELDPLDRTNAQPAGVTVKWVGHSAFLRRSARHVWPPGQFRHVERFGGGWLEIGAERDATVRVRLLGATDPQGQDITPPARFLRSWAVDNTGVEFPVSHSSATATPLRLVVRRVGPKEFPPPRSPVRVTLLDARGEVWREVDVPMESILWSSYDAVWPELPGTVVSDPIEVFFRLPAKVSRVRITAQEHALVNGYSRPLDLPRAVRTPEDATVPEASKSAIPAWFNLQPDDAEARLLNGASRLFTVQERLPDDRPDLIAGTYQWESFTPVNNAGARVFLAPREEGVPERIEGLAGTFRPVGATAPVVFLPEPGRLTVPARLAWVSDKLASFDYAVSVDGQLWASGAAAGMAGEVVLPPVKPGNRQIEISAPAGIRWFGNYLERGTPWVKRIAFRFDKPLQFEIDRTSALEEFLSVRLFRPAGSTGRVKVAVRIEAPAGRESVGPLPGWLMEQRIHDVRPTGQLALPIAESAGQKADAGQAFFIPFPRGAPAGRYRVTLSAQGGESWVSASRITPGATAKPKLILESVKNGE